MNKMKPSYRVVGGNIRFGKNKITINCRACRHKSFIRAIKEGYLRTKIACPQCKSVVAHLE